MNYLLLGLLIASNVALAFYIFRAARLARNLKKVRARLQAAKVAARTSAPLGLQRKTVNPEMAALVAASPLSGLERYARSRLPIHKKIENHLPPLDCDFAEMRDKKVRRVKFDTTIQRSDMSNHALRIRNWFAGKSELLYLNALCIAYLRRRTPHSEHARALFLRLWTEQGEFLAANASTRWLLSALMTFMDHGENVAQRVIGAAGIAFGNTVKVYEWEGAARGGYAHDFDVLEAAATNIEGIPDVGRISVANADIFRNMLASYIDLSFRDPVAGRVLITLLIRFHGTDTIFSRLDDAKLEADSAPDGDSLDIRHWSFGQHPHEPTGAQPDKDA